MIDNLSITDYNFSTSGLVDESLLKFWCNIHKVKWDKGLEQTLESSYAANVDFMRVWELMALLKHCVTNALPCVDSIWTYVESQSDAPDSAIDSPGHAVENVNQ